MVLRAPERPVDSARIYHVSLGLCSNRTTASVAWVTRDRWAATTSLCSWRCSGARGAASLLRPYVFGFLAVYLTAAAAAWGWRRAAAFTGLGRRRWRSPPSGARPGSGFPFGLYHYTGATVGRELYLSNVPFFDPLSFTFLAYASLGLAGAAPRRRDGTGPASGRRAPSPGRAGRAPHDVARRRDRSPGGAGRPVVPRPDLLLSGARLVLRGPGRELRRVGGRRRGDRLGLDRPRPPRRRRAARLGERAGRGTAARRRDSTTSCWPSTWRSRRRWPRPALFWAGVLLHVPAGGGCSMLSTIAGAAAGPATRA